MHLRLRSSRKSIYVTLAALLFYWFLLKKRRYTETFQVVLDSTEPRTAWEYIADFSNQKKLNPTINEFEIEYEKGNYALWEYGVSYREHFAVIPLLYNHNRAVFRVTPESGKGHHHQPYRIDIQTDAQMTFKAESEKNKHRTIMQEVVHYECPPLLSYLCTREVRTQKKLTYDRVLATDMNSSM